MKDITLEQIAAVVREAAGTLCSFDGKAPSLSKPSLIIAANSPQSCARILDCVRAHLPALPY